MKLAEALNLRADWQKTMEHLQSRIVMSGTTHMRTIHTPPEWTSHRITIRFDCFYLIWN